MHKRRMLSSLFLGAALLLSVCLPVRAASGSHWADGIIEKWAQSELIPPAEDGAFHPDDSITRTEFIAALNRLLPGALDADTGLMGGGITRQDAAALFAQAFQLLDAPEETEQFIDRADISDSAAGAVGALVKAGYLSGYPDGSFRPEALLTRAEALTILDGAEVLVNFYLNYGDYAELAMKPYTGPNMSKGLDRAQSEQYIDITKGNQQPITGYYYLSFQVDGVERTAKVYIPEVAPLRCYFTVIAVPDGWNTEEFLWESGWLDLADEAQEALFILEAAGGDGAWGSPEEEYAYVQTALGSAGLEGKTFYNLHGVHYLAGYGTGGTALQQWAVNTPLKVISAVFLDTQDLSQDVLTQAGSRLFGTGEDSFPASLYYDPVPYDEVPVPAWFIHSDLDAVQGIQSYFLGLNDCLAQGESTAYGTTYWQAEDSDRWGTNYSDVRSQVSVREGASDYGDAALTQSIHTFLTQYTRYDNTSVYGNVLGERLPYTSDNLDINQMYVEEEDGSVWTREYLIYEPDNREERFPDGAPVVYVFAGGSQPDRLFLDATHWWEVADEYGFIVCVPCSQYSGSANTPIETRWNFEDTDVTDEDGNLIRARADDYAFVRQLVEEVDSKYPTDPDRRFVTGQSNGSMFSRNLAQRMPELFAAIGSTSATSDIFPDETTDVIPVYLQYGENDNGGANEAGYKVYDIVNNKEGNPFKTLAYWLERNGAVVEDSQFPENSAVLTENQGMLGRQHYYTWSNEDGVPVYRYGWTEGRSHNCSVDDMWLLWESWFSKWSLDENGDRLYSESGFAADDAVLLPAQKG